MDAGLRQPVLPDLGQLVLRPFLSSSLHQGYIYYRLNELFGRGRRAGMAKPWLGSDLKKGGMKKEEK